MTRAGDRDQSSGRPVERFYVPWLGPKRRSRSVACSRMSVRERAASGLHLMAGYAHEHTPLQTCDNAAAWMLRSGCVGTGGKPQQMPNTPNTIATSNKRSGVVPFSPLSSFPCSFDSPQLLTSCNFCHRITLSALGYTPVYNLLPGRIVQDTCVKFLFPPLTNDHATNQATCVKQFQCLLQRLVIDRAASGAAKWHCTLSSLVSLCTHPLRYCE